MQNKTNSSGNKSLPKKIIVFSVLLAVLLFSRFILPKFQHNNQIEQQETPVTDTILVDDSEKDSFEELAAESESEPIEISDTLPEDDNCTHEIQEDKRPTLDKNGIFTTKEDVALYIHLYKCLPRNFITKRQAQGVNLKAENKCIGGDRFHNREGILPKAKGRTYTECDIDTLGKSSRGPKRIVFSNDGLIYYTSNHYQSFVLLYGEAN